MPRSSRDVGILRAADLHRRDLTRAALFAVPGHADDRRSGPDSEQRPGETRNSETIRPGAAGTSTVRPTSWCRTARPTPGVGAARCWMMRSRSASRRPGSSWRDLAVGSFQAHAPRADSPLTRRPARRAPSAPHSPRATTSRDRPPRPHAALTPALGHRPHSFRARIVDADLRDVPPRLRASRRRRGSGLTISG
jgi:hypothetical protein